MQTESQSRNKRSGTDILVELRKREHFPRKLIFKWSTLESTAGHLLVCGVTNGQDAVVVDVAPAGVQVGDVSTSGGSV